MADKKPNNFQDIHVEDYLAEYEHNFITNESLMFDFRREKQSLNGDWNYAIDQYDTCLRQKWFNENYCDSKGYSLPVDFSFDQWPVMKIPSSWNTIDPQFLLYEGPMTFTRCFDFSQEAHKNQRVFLKVGAINYTARLFLNKEYIGLHRGGSTPFYIEITKNLKETNRLIIVADSTRRPEQVPTENTDWFNYGGIYRDVELLFVPQIFIKNFQISLKKDNSFKNLQAHVVLSEKTSGTAVVSIPELSLTKEIKITDGVGNAAFPVENLKLWEPDNPKLYNVEATFEDDIITDEVGFRQISVENNNICLNGKPLFLKGISAHEESVPNGKALTDEERIENFKIAKEMGCNFMRLAHYPHHENASRLADKIGILLWEEVPVYWAIKFNHEKTYLDAENQLKELIMRDFNRCSVIIWSVGNENSDTDERLSFMSKLATTAHQLDNTRLVSAACLVDQVNNKIADRLKLWKKSHMSRE